jgi:hypothetical protein
MQNLIGNVNMKALILGGGLIYIAAKTNLLKNQHMKTAALAVGAITLARQVPVVKTIV